MKLERLRPETRRDLGSLELYVKKGKW
jgi:hypothetical protein